MGGPTQVDYAGAACKMRGKHERNHKFVVALPRAQAFDRRRQFGRGTTRNHPEPPRNHPKSAAEPPRNHPGTTAEPIRNPARPNPIGTCGASICLNWHWLVTGSRHARPPDELRNLLVRLRPHARTRRRISVEKAESTQRCIHVLRHRRAAEGLRTKDLFGFRSGYQEMVRIIVQDWERNQCRTIKTQRF